MIELGIKEEKNAPQSICPGPNAAWFNGVYSLKGMVGHILGKISSLVPETRPHMFISEVEMYVEYLKKQVQKAVPDKKELRKIEELRNNLVDGINDCIEIAKTKAYPGENLKSIIDSAPIQLKRIENIMNSLAKKMRVRSKISTL